MPPLNRLLEDQENNFWHHQVTQQNDSRHSSFRIALEGPFKISSEATAVSRQTARFSDKEETYPIISREDYSEQETMDCWYTAREFASFRQDACTCVYLDKTDKDRIDEVEYTMRGVEHRTKQGSTRRYTLRSHAKRTVLDEQDLQDGMGESNPDMLAAAYARTASDAVFDALNIAAVDQLEAERHQYGSAFDQLFSDDWISSISKGAVDISTVRDSHDADISVFEASGFDDSWLRDITLEA